MTHVYHVQLKTFSWHKDAQMIKVVARSAAQALEGAKAWCRIAHSAKQPDIISVERNDEVHRVVR